MAKSILRSISIPHKIDFVVKRELKTAYLIRLVTPYFKHLQTSSEAFDVHLCFTKHALLINEQDLSNYIFYMSRQSVVEQEEEQIRGQDDRLCYAIRGADHPDIRSVFHLLRFNRILITASLAIALGLQPPPRFTDCNTS